jgi:hypothetical protein
MDRIARHQTYLFDAEACRPDDQCCNRLRRQLSDRFHSADIVEQPDKEKDPRRQDYCVSEIGKIRELADRARKRSFRCNRRENTDSERCEDGNAADTRNFGGAPLSATLGKPTLNRN